MSSASGNRNRKYADWWLGVREDLKDLIGVPYRLGAEAKATEWPPKYLDCSELVELVFSRNGVPCPDGSWNIWSATRQSFNPRPGDLGFFARDKYIRDGNPKGVYHVGIIFDEKVVVEARALEGDKYRKVIYRPRTNWERFEPFKNAGGWRRLNVMKELLED